MNVVADWLFNLLLGWTRGLFNNIWNLVNNHSAGISGFLERFWLPIILIILLAGTAADYLVWIIRWRPHYVWRSWFMRQERKKRMNATEAYMNDLDQSPLDLDDGLLEDTPISPVLAYGGAENSLEGNSFPWEYPCQQPDMPQEAWQDPAHIYSPAPTPDFPDQEPEPSLPSAAWTAWEPSVAQETDWQSPNTDYLLVESLENDETPMEVPTEKPVSRRRRRTVTKRQRQSGLLKSLRETLFDPMEPAEPLDSLAPPISQEEAYHEPYYPANYRYRSVPEDNNEGQQ
ncbi:MAG: hypothetical protein PHP07_01265 [Eubacteriales bacterium]|jgi:hypothetical protein|nr:hypothetical protein [Eubacteriales bacterium]MDD3571565.1 hypothetical protein [Eubacteriales bacterium]MDD4134250.1 hypothetical protein [Eubacteriales bacterium]NLO13695.1 hypothetical protein [Clostridiales bacterium]